MHPTSALRSRFQPHVILLGLIAVVALAFAVGCAVDRTNVTPVQASQLEVLETAHAEAIESGDPIAIEKADTDLKAFEARVLRENAGLVVAGLSSIHPLVGALSPLIMGFAPLLGKRGRKHAKNAAKNLSTAKVVAAVVDVGRYLGIAHSSPDTAAVASGEKVAVTPG